MIEECERPSDAIVGAGAGYLGDVAPSTTPRGVEPLDVSDGRALPAEGRQQGGVHDRAMVGRVEGLRPRSRPT